MFQPDIIVYHMPYCPYCTWAKQLLDSKNVKYTLMDVSTDSALRQEMEDRSRGNSVPQIFIGEYHVGGYDDLAALEDAGELDPMLSTEA